MSACAPPAPALPSADSVLEQANRENFTVACALLGRRCRAHLMAIYGYARLVDDVGDEAAGDAPAGDEAAGRREALLDQIEAELDSIYAGRPPQHPVMAALAGTVEACALPAGPFRRLLEANRQDQRVTRYETFDQLLAYCDLSATPVGELVLHVFGAATPERVALSDRICAGLQLLEHLQDVAEDYARGRIYMPAEDLARLGVAEADLAGGAPRELIELEAERAHALLSEGAPLARTLPPRPRIAVAGFVAGGRAALDALRRGRRSPRVFAAGFAKAAIGR
jgi:squalene synthase HpnC